MRDPVFFATSVSFATSVFFATSISFATFGLLVCVGGCGGSDEDSQQATAETPTPSTPGARADEARLRMVDAIARPPHLDAQGVATIEDELRARVDLSRIPETPTVGTPGALVAMPSEGPFIGRVPPDPAIPVSTPQPFLVREPHVRVDGDGVAWVHVETSRAVPFGNVSYGAVMADAPLSAPRFRHRAAGLVTAEGAPPGVYAYAARMDLRAMLGPVVDVSQIARTGRGAVAWRLELADVSDAGVAVFDGEQPFRLVRDGEGARFEALPKLTHGPELDALSSQSVTITFETDAATAAFVALFPEGRAARLFESTDLGTRHEITLDGLEVATRYRYQPVVIERGGRVHVHRGGTFETYPDALTKFSFVVLGDSRSGHGSADERYGGTNARVLRALFERIAQDDPRFVVFAGDLIDGYTTHPGLFEHELAQWRRVVQPFAAHLPIYETMGNHEALIDLWSDGTAAYRIEPSAEAIFARVFVNPENAPAPRAPTNDVPWPTYSENVFSFDVGEVHVASVNSNYAVGMARGSTFRRGQREGTLDDVQLEWLDADLRAARERGAKHLVVVTHEPAFPNGGHAKDAMWWDGQIPEMVAMRDRFARLLGAHGVLALVCADEHNYSRLRVDDGVVEGVERPFWQLVSGGAGAPYYAQERDVPWADRVAFFDPRQHYLRFDVDGAKVELVVIGVVGEEIERVTLTR